MSWKTRLFLALLALACTRAGAVEVAGVSLEDRASVAGNELVLNGAGARIKMVFKIYAIGLYLPQKSDSAAGVLAAKGPRRIQIVTLRELTAEQLSEALIEFLRKNQSNPEMEKIQARVDTLQKIMLGIGKVPEKTRIQLDYLPASGTRVYVDGQQKGADIAGEDFYQALLKIWLGEHVPQENLREALLGRKN